MIKDRNRVIKLLIFLLLPGLIACQNNDYELFWDGQWKRRIMVPEGVQGRCFDEVLSIDKKIWQLTAVIHSTYECDQPFLELAFEGLLEEVLVKKGSDDSQITFHVEAIHLTQMIDLSASLRTPLSKESVERLSLKYVPEKWQSFHQQVFFSKDKQRMSSALFLPSLMVATPNYPKTASYIAFQRNN